MAPPRRFEKPKTKPMAVLRKLWPYLFRHRVLIVAAAVMSVLGNVLGLLSPKLSGLAIDAI